MLETLFPADNVTNGSEQHDFDKKLNSVTTIQSIKPVRSASVMKTSVGGKEITVNAYVTMLKQRRETHMSGLRNITRFCQSDDDPQEDTGTELLLKADDLFINKRNYLIKIHQQQVLENLLRFKIWANK